MLVDFYFLQQMISTAPTTEAKPEVVRDPRRIYSNDFKKILASNPKFTKFPINLPYVIYVNLGQIEDVVVAYAHRPDEIQIDHVATLGLPKELIDQLTEKAFELCEMIENADNDDYPNHLSRGPITNVAMTCIRRAFYIAVLNNPDLKKEVETLTFKSKDPKFNPYPFVEVEPRLKEYLSHLFLRIYESGLTKALIPLYFACILQLCCYTKFVGFNVPTPLEGIRWESLFDSIFRIVDNSNITSPGDYREWVRPRNAPRYNQPASQQQRKKKQEQPLFPLNDFSHFPALPTKQ